MDAIVLDTDVFGHPGWFCSLVEPVRRCFGGIGKQVAAGVELRHDNGSQYISDDFQDETGFLGLRSSPAFVRAPEGNGCVEHAIRTLREQLLWALALLDWAELYNEQWLIERHGFRARAAAP